MAQSVAFQCDFGFELFAAQIAEVTSLGVVSVHVGLQVVPAAASIVAQVAGVRLQTCTQNISELGNHADSREVFLFFILCLEKNKKNLVKISNVL